MTKAAMPYRRSRQVLRCALITLPVVILLAWVAPVKPEATQQAADTPVLPGAAGSRDRSAIAGPAAPDVDNPDSLPATAGGTGPTDNHDRRDLTVFFSIGVIVNILMVAAFIYWAVGQWSGTKK